jgi:class 3 adenylate cyclase/tetratricopeptide (TPR) repeat protein
MPTCPRCGEENPEHARFCHACASPLDGGAPASRRLVTVLFCDVTGSTAMGERQDPEQLRRVLSRYATEARTVIERHGGTVEKFIGDAVMAAFGIPVLHEDDALRAARAAVELRTALARLNTELERDVGITIQTRIGINSGEVIAGDPSGGEGFVTGDAVNVAKRLEESAGPGEILIGDETQRLARDAIQSESVEPLALRGKRERIRAHKLLDVTPGALAHARRFDSPMVGRERELALLEEAFARTARERSCHLFTVRGSAGVGKSRLLNEALRDIGADAQVLRGACLPYGEGITFWPVLEIVKQATGVTEDDSPDEAKQKIAAVLEDDQSAQIVAERIAEVVGLSAEAGIAEEGFWAVRKLLEALAHRRPVIAVFDDLNWAEPTLLDLVEHVAEWARDAPILLVCLSRPELLDVRPGWGGGKRNATSIFLEPLSEHESEVLIENLVGGAVLDADARARIQEASAGNPLFVEEMVAMLVDEGLLGQENGRWFVRGDLSSVRVPASIQVLLASRLDQLGVVERQILERGAVEGNVFHRGAVVALAPGREPAELERGLQELVRKELIRLHRATFAGEEGFSFRHPLIREATYDALPKQARSELHEAYAGWLERRPGEYEEIRGYHLEQAVRYRRELGPLSDAERELGVRASQLLASAGRRALSRGDAPAAVDLLTRAVLLQPERSALRLELLPDLAAALREAGELARAEQYLEEALSSAREAGDRGAELAASIERVALLLLSDPARPAEQLEAVEASVPLLEELGNERVLASAWTLIATRFGLWQGRFARGEQALEKALSHARRAGDRRQEAMILFQLCFAAVYGPAPVSEAIRRCEQILEEARGDRLVEAGVARYLASLEARRGRFAEARLLATRTRAMYEELGMELLGQVLGTLACGEVELLAGDSEAAERALRSGAAVLERMGERGYLSSVQAFLAEALYRLGRLDAADEVALRSLENASEEDIWSQAVGRGTRAKILARRGDFDEAERCAREAVLLVEDTDALDLHGSALLALAEVLLHAERNEEAAALAADALRVFERKENAVSAEAARSLAAAAAQPRPVRAAEGPDDRAS